jgi:Cu+-exporting ATPase
MKGKLTMLPTRPPVAPGERAGEGAIDPVCGMTVDPRSAAGSHAHGGRTYWFCSTHCVERFRADPDRYLGASPRREAHAPGHSAGGQAGDHTCPMHPEVRLPVASACPACGMALEPVDLEAPTTRTEWVCPMHPEIVRAAPGACPICGMALEPRTVTLEEEASPELRDMTRRFWIGLVLAIPWWPSPCRT